MASNVKDIDHGWKRIVRQMGVADGSRVNIGVLSDSSTWANGAPANLVDIATFNEFGAPKANIPSRPFMAQSFDMNIQRIQEKQKSLNSKVLNDAITEEQALKELGVYFKGVVQEIFRKGSFTPNKPATIRAKTINGRKGTSPLIDTGRLRQSIHFEVKK